MTVEVRYALRLLHLIKGKMPNVYTILGGIHPCLYPEETCKHPLVTLSAWARVNTPPWNL